MRFVFWQNMISIHQQAFLQALAARPGADHVMLVAEHTLARSRKDMGWDVPVISGVEVVISPSADKIAAIVNEYADAVHIMGGIRVGSMVSAAFDECIKRKCKVGIMTEPFDDAGAKGLLRGLKYRYYISRYARHISFVLAIGRQGVQQYRSLGFDDSRLFPWAYFIAAAPAYVRSAAPAGDVRIIYAGRLQEAKGIYRFMRELTAAGLTNFQMDIYGEGPDQEKIQQLVAGAGLAGKVTFTPFMPYDRLLERYAGYDWVVLPSAQKDGWGVVVSEGMMRGLKAVCSNICGVSRVIQEGVNGVTFDWSVPGSCKAAIVSMLTGGGFAADTTIAAWAGDTLSGAAGAAYFMKIMECVNGNADKPPMPWEKVIER